MYNERSLRNRVMAAINEPFYAQLVDVSCRRGLRTISDVHRLHAGLGLGKLLWNAHLRFIENEGLVLREPMLFMCRRGSCVGVVVVVDGQSLLQGRGNRSSQSGPMFTLFHRHFSNNLPNLVVGVAESLAADYGAVNAYALMSVVESHSQTN